MQNIIYKIILIYIPSFHLEVLGSGGALWGFSAILGFRNETNNLLWSYICIFITFIFFFIWILKIKIKIKNMEIE